MCGAEPHKLGSEFHVPGVEDAVFCQRQPRDVFTSERVFHLCVVHTKAHGQRAILLADLLDVVVHNFSEARNLAP